MPHVEHEEHHKHHKPEAECGCDKDCKCGCQEGKSCTCGGGEHYGCSGHCHCRRMFVKFLFAIILFLAGFGLASVCHCCGGHSRMMKAHHNVMPGDGAGSVVIINTDGHVGFDRFRGKHHHKGKHQHAKPENFATIPVNNVQEVTEE